MMNAPELDPLHLPLHGRQVIEASAGTGKTWTLAALYLRLVLGHQREFALLPPQILVMTFTDAATAELRDRIRQRLSEAARYFEHSAQKRDMPNGWQPDDFLQKLRDSYAHTDWPACALQLNTAAEWMDEGAIYTIHAWSRRMLSQHALDSHNLFEQTRLEDAQALQLSLTHDYWRQWFYPLPADTLALIQPLVGEDPSVLLENLQVIWKQQERKPFDVVAPTQTPTDAIQAHLQWQEKVQATAQQARHLWSDAVLQALVDARAQGFITGTGVSAPNFAKWLMALQQWVQLDDTVKPEVLERFTIRFLKSKNWPQVENWPFFAALETHVDVLHLEPDTATAIAQHAAYEIGQAYQQAKTQRAAFDFSDLLQNLYRATTAGDGRLAAAIRAQYPVALVDEFQDTDPWQYGTLDCIYDAQRVSAQNAWVMIGDPKQAIYSFRGADLSTYLKARSDALTLNPDALHTLRGNRRSHHRLVNAVNHVFACIDQPFACAQGTIDYVQVTAEGKVAPWSMSGQDAPAFHVWHLPSGEKPNTAAVHLRHMSQAFADHMAELLNAGLATPGEMAVLVRGQTQADAMRAALRERQIASVYLSDHASVYQTDEALDLWRVLRAIASPRQTHWVRAALASKLWGLPLPQVMALIDDETQWETLLEQCHRWHQVWQQQGVLPMLYQWLHTQHIAHCLLRQPNGERRLSNVLHLGELLQHAAQSLQGIPTLVRYLEEQIHQPNHSTDSQKMRLETDAQCVQVITYHKSKGLQFPLVFIPFAGSFRTETSGKNPFAIDEDDGADAQATSSVEEDMRLLYVALTRAEKALWLGVSETHNDMSGSADKGTLKRSALSRLLNRQQRGDLSNQLHALWGDCSDIHIRTTPDITHTLYAPSADGVASKPALVPQRRHHSLWWTASFSALTRGLSSESLHEEAFADAQTDALTSELEDGNAELDVNSREIDAPASPPWQSFPAGARYGTLLHDLLEWQTKHRWPLASTDAPNQTTWQSLVERKAKWLQLKPQDAQQLTPWVQRLITTPLPLQHLGTDLVLSQLPPTHVWAEMAFSFEAHHVLSDTLDALIQQHLFADTPRPALQPRTLNGMLTGFMDLVLQHDGKYWVLDYKSNRLPNYASPVLRNAILEKRYDVQYVLYTLALHRLLTSRLPDYDYDRHMGGCIYLFLRGIEESGAGVHVQRPSKALIEALDKAFANTAHTTDTPLGSTAA
jgi:exodeoxyribonuclease V beta subunit